MTVIWLNDYIISFISEEPIFFNLTSQCRQKHLNKCFQ